MKHTTLETQLMLLRNAYRKATPEQRQMIVEKAHALKHPPTPQEQEQNEAFLKTTVTILSQVPDWTHPYWTKK